MKKLLLLIFFSTQCFNLISQKRVDLFYAGFNYNLTQTDSVNTQKNNETAIVANISIPVVFKDSSIWMTSLDYQNYSVANNYLSTDSAPIELFKLNAFVLRTGYIHRFNSSQALHAFIIPRVMTDFNAPLSKSFQFGGLIMYEKIKNKNLTWRAGLIFNQEFFGPYITPVLYIDWNIYKKLKFTGMLPVYGKLYLQQSEKLSYGLHFIGLTTSYRINELNYQNYYVERNSVDVSFFANRRLWKNIFFEARAGYSLSKDYGLYDQNQKVSLGFPLIYFGDDRTRSNRQYKGSVFIHARLIYSLPIK